MGDVSEDEARIALAAELYRERKMTVKQAADTATVNSLGFPLRVRKKEGLLHNYHRGGFTRGTWQNMIVSDTSPLVVLFKARLLFILKQV